MPKASKPLPKAKAKPSKVAKATLPKVALPKVATPKARPKNNRRTTRPKQRVADLAHIEKRRNYVAYNLLAGMSFRDIANALEKLNAKHAAEDPNYIPMECSIGTIKADVDELFKQWQNENVTLINQHIALRMRQYNILINGVFDRARTGTDDKAIDSFCKIADRQDTLIGANAPVRVVHSWKDEAAQKNLPINDIYEGVVAGIMDKLRQQQGGKGNDRTADVIH
jgi:hypothetical protein